MDRGARPIKFSGLGVVALAAIITANGCEKSSAPPPAASSGPWSAPAAANAHNVLLVTIDTLRADRLGCYGFEAAQTPTIDSLANNNGVRFDDAVATAPLTLPSHSSILTGWDVPHHGVRCNGEYRLTDEQTTLAEILKSAGYRTAAFTSAFVLDAQYGLNQGFDLYHDDFKQRTTEMKWGAELERPADEVTDVALEWLTDHGSNHADSAFFAWVHYYDPHDEYEPPAEFARKFKSSPYDGEIAFVDHELARIIKHLDSSGMRDNTLIVVVADHGESLGEHNERTHGHLIYDSSMHIPMIFHSPSAISGRFVVDDRVVSTIDIVPTILDLLGMDTDHPFDGQSLIQPSSSPNRAVYMETLLPFVNHGWAPLYALRRHGDKFIEAPRPEYFNLTTDPDELDNLFVEQLQPMETLVEDLGIRLARWDELGADETASIYVDESDRTKLDALGYISAPIGDDIAGKRDPKDMMSTWQDMVDARGMIDAGEYSKALTLLSDVLKKWPKDLYALECRSELFIKWAKEPSQDKTKCYREAEQTLRKMLAIKPSVPTYITLGQILVDQNRDGELEPLLTQALNIDENAGGVWVLRGDVAAKRGQIQVAMNHYAKAIEVDDKRSGKMARDHAEKVRRAVEQMKKRSGNQ